MGMKVIIFDDHKLFGSVLKTALQQEIEIEFVEYIANEQGLYELLETTDNVILLLDINLKKIGIEDSFQFAKELLNEKGNTKIVFLSAYNLPLYIRKAHAIGASGFFSKDVLLPDLMKGLRIIELGGSVFRQESTDFLENLTLAETKVLKLASKGMRRDEIAEELNISNRTVGRHLENIFDKLQAKNITEAVSIALENGYIPPIV